MPSVNEFKRSWDKSGRPRTIDGIAQVLRDASLSEEQMEQVFESQGLKYQSPLKYPEPEQVQAEEPQTQPEEQLPIPVGFKIKTKTGKELEWKGAQWVSKGKIVPKKYKEQIDAAAQRELKRQMAQKKKDEEEAQRQKDAEYDFEDQDYEPEATPDQKVQAMQDKVKDKKPNEMAYLAALMKMAGMTANDIDAL